MTGFRYDMEKEWGVLGRLARRFGGRGHETAEEEKWPLARRLGDGGRPTRRRIMLEEVTDGVTSLTPFDPQSVLYRAFTDNDRVFEYTVQDMLDEVGKDGETRVPRFRTSAEYFEEREAAKVKAKEDQE